MCVLYFTAATVQGPVFNEFRKTALFLFFVALWLHFAANPFFENGLFSLIFSSHTGTLNPSLHQTTDRVCSSEKFPLWAGPICILVSLGFNCLAWYQLYSQLHHCLLRLVASWICIQLSFPCVVTKRSDTRYSSMQILSKPIMMMQHVDSAALC